MSGVMGDNVWILQIQILAAAIFILMIAQSVKRLPIQIWAIKSAILFVYLFFICVAIFHEMGHIFVCIVFGIKYTYHFNLVSLPHVIAEGYLPPTIKLIFLAMGSIFQAVLGYTFLFSNWNFLRKFREEFLDKNLKNITLFLMLVLLGGFLDIYGIY